MKFTDLPLAGKPVEEQIVLVSQAATKDLSLLNQHAAHVWMKENYAALRAWAKWPSEQPPAP